MISIKKKYNNFKIFVKKVNDLISRNFFFKNLIKTFLQILIFMVK